MKNSIRRLFPLMSILFAAPVFVTNPFLDAKEDERISVNVGDTEWGDEQTYCTRLSQNLIVDKRATRRKLTSHDARWFVCTVRHFVSRGFCSGQGGR